MTQEMLDFQPIPCPFCDRNRGYRANYKDAETGEYWGNDVLLDPPHSCIGMRTLQRELASPTTYLHPPRR
jgi:hypothetical protein